MRNSARSVQEVAPRGDADFRGVLATLLSKLWLILLLTVMAAAGALLFVNTVKPKYTGEARVILEYRDNYFTRPDRDMKGFEQPLDAEAVQSQVQAIMSRDLAKRVVKKLNLGALEEFDPLKKGPGTVARVLSILGLGKDKLAATPEERVLETYFEKLLVYNVGKSRVIAIEFSSRDPELAARGANTVADEYIAMTTEAKQSTTKGASAWLASAIEPMRLKVAEAEGRVEAYRAQNGLLVGGGTTTTTIVAQQLGELSTQMSNARASQSELQAKSRIIREALRNGRVFETSEVVNNELIRRLLEQRVAMKTQLALEERTLLPGHPRMKELQAQLADLESQIRVAAERTARTLENDAKVAGARVQQLQRELESQKGTAATANEAEVQLRALEREAKALRENYEQYLSKYRDATLRDTGNAAPADARIISRAIEPNQPSFPKKLPIILLATLATLVLTSAIIMTRALFATDGYEAPDTLVEYTEAPVSLAAQPEGEPLPAAAVAASPPEPGLRPVAVPAARPVPKPPVAPATAAALAPVLDDIRGMAHAGRGVLIGTHAFASDVLSEATAVPLARLLSEQGPTVLVDLGGAPDIDALLPIGQAVGMSDLLTGAGVFGEAIHRDRRTRLHVIPYGLTGYGQGEPDVEGKVFNDVFDALLQSYAHVVVSAGGLGREMDALIPRENLVLVVSSQDENDPHVTRALDEIEALGPGAVTVVVEDPMIATPRPANDRLSDRIGAA